MVHNSLPAATASSLPLPADPLATSSAKSAVAKGQFKSIYLSLPILQSDTLQEDGPAPIKKTVRTNPDSAAATPMPTPTPTPAPPSPNPLPAARALTVAFSAPPAEDQSNPHTSSQKSSAKESEEPAATASSTPSQYSAAPHYNEVASVAPVHIPAPSLGEQLALPPAAQTPDSNFIRASLAEYVSKPAASTPSAANSINSSSSPSKLNQIPAAAAQLTQDYQTLQSSSPSAPPPPAPVTLPPAYESAPVKSFAPVPASASIEPQVDATPRRIRNLSPSQGLTSVAMPATPTAQASTPPPAVNPATPSSQPQQNAPAVDPSSAAAAISKGLSTAPDNLALSIHLKNQDPPASPEPEKPQTANPRADASDTKRADLPAAASASSSAASDADAANLVAKQSSNVTVNLPATVVPTAARDAAGPSPWISQQQETIHVPAALAVHEAQPVASDSPKASLNGEILLHLQGNDQSSAAIRLVDRAGSVNVSVHASDSDLRNSLRSNVGELVSQLNGQGWKADVDKPAIATVRAQTSQDPQSGGQRSPGQQQPPSDGERQPQRDRRSSNRWLDELQQQTSSQSGSSGGKG